jgi:predicted PurR-regulated permease PerM
MKFPFRFKQIMVVTILLITLGLLYRFREILPIFILALLLAYILTPVIVWLSSKRVFRRKISRGLSVIMIYIVLITSLSFGGAFFVINLSNEIQTLIQDIPHYGEQLTKNWVPSISKGVQNVSKYLPKIEKTDVEKDTDDQSAESHVESQPQEDNEILEFIRNTRFEIKQDKKGFEIIPHRITYQEKKAGDEDFDLAKYIDDFISDIFENLQSILLSTLDFGQTVIFSVVTSVFQTFITLMIAAFIIIDHERILDFFRGLFPERVLARVEMFLQRQNQGLAGVVRGQLIICFINGILTGIGLVILDVKFALTLSLLATVCSIIPIFGVIISSVPIVLMAITSSLLSAVLAMGWILIIHFVEGNILNPRIMGKSADIHPILVILALMAGERAYGIFGALIAVPIFSILQNTFLFIREVVFESDGETLDATGSQPYASLDEAIMDD